MVAAAAGEQRSRPDPVVGVGAVVVDAEGRLLVVLRRDPPAAGRWTIPGGRLEPGERIVEAVAREVAEETGLEVAVGELAGVAESIGEDHHLVIIDHHAEVVGGALRAGDDALDARFMSGAELAEAETTAGLRDFLRRAGVELDRPG